MWAPASLILSENVLEEVIHQIREMHYADYENVDQIVSNTEHVCQRRREWEPSTALTVAQDVTEPGVCRTLTTPESQKVLGAMKHVETDQSNSSIILCA